MSLGTYFITTSTALDPRRDRHHFLPRHHLAHFAAPDGLLFVYDRRHCWDARRDIPERLAVEKHLYAPETPLEPGGDPKDDAVERWLAAEIDEPAATPLADLARGMRLTDLSEESWHAIADFLALLDLRTPAIRDLLTPVFGAAVTNEIADHKRTQKQLRKRGIYVTRSDVRRVHRRTGNELAAELAKPAWLNYLQQTRAIARLNIKARRWSILDAPPEVEFVTSDLGIGKSLIGPLNPAHWEPGTALGRAHWIVPISPRRAIAITPKPFPDDPMSSPELIKKTNEQLARDARRYVYSHTKIDPALFSVAPGIAGTTGTVPSTG